MLIVVSLQQSGDEDEDLGNVLDFSNVLDEAEGSMETSLDDSSAVDESMLSDVKEVQFIILKHCTYVSPCL